MPKHTNRLINETSPYLLQHAHNPVDWYAWGEEALEKSKKENKPILVSIGYAACHWCHVMEKESFENESTAQLMNEYFVNIKVDREERPDLDHIYMDAVQAIAGNGGWPLNVFLTPEGKPFYGGTYFPPQRAFNRASWTETLQAVKAAFDQRRNEIDSQADNLTEHLRQSNLFGQNSLTKAPDLLFSGNGPDEAFENIMKAADKEWGGFGRAPKFPQTFTIQYLLRYYWLTGKREALQQSVLSLDKMIAGGIYDHVGGGFARYSTDTEWLAPHFEKMLYDNALLVSVLSEAFQLTKKQRYREVIEEIFEFIKRELSHSSGSFYSALDADSEGEEGKFYVWNYEEVIRTIGNKPQLFCEYYNITPTGNWEGKNILHTPEEFESFCAKKSISPAELKQVIEDGKLDLLQKRNQRTRPSVDDKIILGWNALMNTALCKAFAATGNDNYKLQAEKNTNFLFENLQAVNGIKNDYLFYHTWKNSKPRHPAFLDDYAFLIESLLHLYEISAVKDWLNRAKELTEYVIDNFSDEQNVHFYYTHKQQQDLILRKKEIYDGAIPSATSVMAYNLYRLSILFDISEWKQRAQRMASSVSNVTFKYPTSFGIWACFIQEIISGTSEIAILGSDFQQALNEVLAEYIPHKILMAAKDADNRFPLLAGKASTANISVYLCKDFTCQAPFYAVSELISKIKATES